MTTIVDGTTGITFPSTISGVSATQQYSGRVLQVVTNSFNNYITSSSTSFVTITGSSTSITPTKTTSQILVVYSFNGLTTINNSATAYQQTYQIIDGSSNVVKSIYNGFIVGGNQTYGQGSINGSFLHSPSTTSSFTYQLQIKGDGSSNGFQINNYGGSNITYSSITLMEIAA